MSNQFKVGSVYRDRNGNLCKVYSVGTTSMEVSMFDGERWDLRLSHHLDGRFFATEDDPDSVFHLLPGELVQVNGEWVSPTPTLDKIEAEKAFTDALARDAADDLEAEKVDPLDRCQEIRSRVAELEDEIKRLEAEHNALLGTGVVDAGDIAWAVHALSVTVDEDPINLFQAAPAKSKSTVHPPIAGLTCSTNFDGLVMKVR